MDIPTLRTLTIENAKIAFQAQYNDYPITDQDGQAFLIAFGTVTPSPITPVSFYAAITYRERQSSITRFYLKGPNRSTAEEAMRALFDTSTEAVQFVLGQQMHSTQGRATQNGGMMMMMQ